jgi:acyl carrier protein
VTATERALADIWAAVLQTAGPGLDDDFFALGGHSLLAVRVIARVNDTFGVALSIRQLFEAPTIRRLARAVDESPRVARTPIRAVDRTTLGRTGAAADERP